MDGCERLIEIIRNQGAKHNPPVPMIGVMGEEGKVKLNDLSLDKDDYLMNCNLRLDPSKKIFYHKEKPSGGEYVSSSGHNTTLEEYKKNLLQEGDSVLMIKIENDEIVQYILLAKVVAPE